MEQPNGCSGSRLAIMSFLLAALSACGGGGDGRPALDSIGGTVSGLTTNLVLQNNGGDSLSVKANGSFTFATKVNTGDVYAVSVVRQPPGGICSVSNGSGTAAADVTDVSVTCSTDPSTVFLPFAATPVASGGTTGLFVVPSNSLDDQPILITNENSTALGYATRSSLSPTGAVTGSVRSSLVYATVGAAGGDHLWALDVTGASSLVARQLGSLTIPSTGICYSSLFQKNLTDPSSAFLILALATDPMLLCGVSSTKFMWILVRLSDATSTAPLALPALSALTIPALYSSTGTLTGLVAVDGANQLNFYADETLASPALLLKDVGTVQALQSAADPTFSYIAAQSASTFRVSLYRVANTGAISGGLYQFMQTIGDTAAIFDSNNLYFTDNDGGTGPENIVQIGIAAGSAAQVLYTYVNLADGAIYMYPIAATASVLILAQEYYPAPVGNLTLTSEIDALAVGAPSTPTAIGSYANLNDIGLYAGNIFVTSAATRFQPSAYSTEITTADGTVLQPLTAQSYFLPTEGSVLMQVQGITDATGIGGGTLYVVNQDNLQALTTNQLKLPNGAPYPFPTGSSKADVSAVTATIGVGHVFAATQEDGLVYDLSQNLVVPITMTNTNIVFL